MACVSNTTSNTAMFEKQLIEDESFETITNVQIILQFLREYHVFQQLSDNRASPTAHAALSIILGWLDDALTHECCKLEKMENEYRQLKKGD